MEIAGQAAIVSGGASGLGLATAEALTAAGVKVTILDINEASATAAARQIGGLAIGCDVTDGAAVEAAVAAARWRHGASRIAAGMSLGATNLIASISSAAGWRAPSYLCTKSARFSRWRAEYELYVPTSSSALAGHPSSSTSSRRAAAR